MPLDESSPVTLVLGATGGIGGSLARHLHERGHRVVAAGRNQNRLDELEDSLGVRTLAFDATSFDEVDAAVAEILREKGRLDGVAHCVGSVFLRPAHRTEPEQWQEVLATNLGSAFAVVRAVTAPMMRAKGGSIVLTASAAAEVGMANHEAIAAAKAGVVGLVRSAAATYARFGVRVNAVAPGLVRTAATAAITASEVTEKASVSMHALGRLGEPSDLVGAYGWLLERSNSWTPGQILSVDGGLARVRPAPRA
jgi:NAD(P)-dependent dehydrogenase (short-subunit alcohol dehydrogenase family)